MRKTFILIGFIAILFLVGLNVYLSQIGKTVKDVSIPTPRSQAIIPPVVASELTSMDSPNGKLTLVMKKTKGEGVTYIFSVSGKEIFRKVADVSTSYSIPYNTWSPDNKYVFLKKTDPTGSKFFVLTVALDASEQTEETANITDLFTQKYPDLKIGDVTGWGGVNLVIINSLRSDGSRGSSFWFEASSHSLIQLSSHF